MASFPREEDCRLIDQYLANELDVAGVAALEDRLKSDAELRAFFVEYSGMELGLKRIVRDRKSLANALKHLQTDPEEQGSPVRTHAKGKFWILAIAASLVCVLAGAGWWMGINGTASVAWVKNAQDCQWDQDSVYRGRFAEGQLVNVREGLLEVGFSSEASVLVEGPALFKILSHTKVQLLEGSIAVKMPKGLAGFEVLTPHGRVLDLGTEFGVSVKNGQVNLAVFDGEVMAVPASEKAKVLLQQHESASIEPDKIQRRTRQPKFVRQIFRKVRVPRSVTVEFGSEVNQRGVGVRDVNDQAIGLSRLDGTGGALLENDENLRLDSASGVLHVRATRSDINHQLGLEVGEYLGRNLSELGFTGPEDFEVKMRVVDAPELLGKGLYGQYGLYVANDVKTGIRGGVILWPEPENYRQFLVNTESGVDRDGNRLGYISPGSNIEITLLRHDGEYSLEIRDLMTENSNTLRVKHPEFLDDCTDFQVGIFVANPFHDEHATINVDSFKVTVWHETAR